jgi:hypothetical protein
MLTGDKIETAKVFFIRVKKIVYSYQHRNKEPMVRNI